MRLSFIALLAFVAATGHQLTAIGAPQAGGTALCDAMASRIRVAADVAAGTRTVWSLLTDVRPPLIEVASISEVSLERDPQPDERVQFEKRIRARYGNAEAVLRDLRAWDNFDIFALPGSQVRMLLTTGGTAQCESRYFFRVTSSRDVVRVPDPPQKTSSDFANAICQNNGGWGYFGRINILGAGAGPASGVEAFVEYHRAIDEESIRVVPLTDAGWQPACTVIAKFRTSSATGTRERLDSVTSASSK